MTYFEFRNTVDEEFLLTSSFIIVRARGRLEIQATYGSFSVLMWHAYNTDIKLRLDYEP